MKKIYFLSEIAAREYARKHYPDSDIVRSWTFEFNGEVFCYRIYDNQNKTAIILVVDASAFYHADQFDRGEDDIPTYELLSDEAELIDTAMEGTCQLYSFGGRYWVVLSDNTVISKEEDEKDDEPIFPARSKSIHSK
jgi:hypothetical protein